jgi:hypothetical protein
MRVKEFVRILKRIKRDWERLAAEDPTAHRSIVMLVDSDSTIVEAEYDTRDGRVEEYTIKVRLEDGMYTIHVLAEEGYVTPVDDIKDVIDRYGLDWAYSVIE